jgi:hypothetical protein
VISERGVQNSSAVNKVAEEQPSPDTIMLDLVQACREHFDKHEKLYFEFGLVLTKKDINREGQHKLKEAAENLSVRALAVARHCVQNIAILSLKSLNQATDVVESATFGREFAEDPCKDLKFALRQLSGSCTFYYLRNFYAYIYDFRVGWSREKET